MQNRNQTAWRKSRKFGDIYGGRLRPKMTDNIFRRLHSLKPPAPEQPIPILIQDNPGRCFFFPLSAEESLQVLQRLPEEHIAGLTHLWLRRIKKSKYDSGKQPLAEFICGSGVRAIVLYPWPRDLILRFDKKPPPASLLRTYSQWTEDLFQENGQWCLRWSLESLRYFYIEYLLLHEVGHHVDRYNRQWSKANRKQVEEFADQYAIFWSAIAREV